MGGRTPGRLVLLECSPRVAPGCLTADAWNVLRGADAVLTGAPDHPQLAALESAGIQVGVRGEADPVRLADTLYVAAGASAVVWLLGTDGEPELRRALAAAADATGTPYPVVEHMRGSYDLPGSHLLDLVAVMDRLRSPGGCPWDAEQTHESLVRYAIEEAYEVVEAVESGDRAHLAEELGDLLAQVAFHARMAAEHATEPFTIDDVADGIVSKLVRRHPHVFARAEEITPAQVEENWEQIKVAEKGRTSVLDGIPAALPALSYAEKVLVRAERTGLQLGAVTPNGTPAGVDPDRIDSAGVDSAGVDSDRIDSDATLGSALLALVAVAHRRGLDPEAALRRAVRDLIPAAEIPRPHQGTAVPAGAPGDLA